MYIEHPSPPSPSLTNVSAFLPFALLLPLLLPLPLPPPPFAPISLQSADRLSSTADSTAYSPPSIPGSPPTAPGMSVDGDLKVGIRMTEEERDWQDGVVVVVDELRETELIGKELAVDWDW